MASSSGEKNTVDHTPKGEHGLGEFRFMVIAGDSAPRALTGLQTLALMTRRDAGYSVAYTGRVLRLAQRSGWL